MDLTAIFDYGGPGADSVSAVKDVANALKSLGVDVDFWSTPGREPKPFKGEEAMKIPGVSQALDEVLREAELDGAAPYSPRVRARFLKDVQESERLIADLIRDFRGGIEDDDPDILRTLRELGGAIPIEHLVTRADLVVQVDTEGALKLYGQAIEEAPRPMLHAELGRLLLRRIEPRHLLTEPPWDVDLSDWLPNGIYELPEEVHFVRPSHDVTSPQVPATHRRQVLQIALESLGRAYGYFTVQASQSKEVTNQEASELLLRQSLVLDGLRAALLELDMPDKVEFVCGAHHAWNDVVNWREREGPLLDLERTFQWTGGFLQGRDTEVSIQQAVDISRNKVIVGDPESFKDDLANAVVARLKPVPELQRLEFEWLLKERLQAWGELPRSVQESLVSAEYYRSMSETVGDYSAPTVLLRKGVERVLRTVSGQHRAPIAHFKREAQGRAFLKPKLTPLAPVDEMLDVVTLAARLGARAAHAEEPYQPVLRHELDDLRERSLWLIGALYKHKR